MTLVDRLKKNKLFAVLPIALIVLLVVTVLVAKRDRGGEPMVSTLDLSTHPVYAKYEFGSDDRTIDIGIQPLWIPTNFIMEAMKRDRFLKKALAGLGMEVRYHPFQKGDDVNFFLGRGDLEAAIGGDMPAIYAAARYDAVVVSLVQYGFCSIVAKRHMLMKELKGMRVGYAFGSNAHYALLQSLASAGLTEADVSMVPLEVHEMPDALDRGEIDAFSAWEPTPSVAHVRYEDQVVIHRSLSSGYLYFSRSFAERHSSAVREILAAELRAINWMNSTPENVVEVSRWALEAQETFTGQGSVLSARQYAALAEKDLLRTSPLPSISDKDLLPDGRLFKEFEFLKGLGKIPDTADWRKVSASFDRTVLDEVLKRTRGKHFKSPDAYEEE